MTLKFWEILRDTNKHLQGQEYQNIQVIEKT